MLVGVILFELSTICCYYNYHHHYHTLISWTALYCTALHSMK